MTAVMTQAGTICKQPDSDGEYGVIGGHGRVDVTTLGFNDEILQKTETYFHNNLSKLGRAYKVSLLDGSGKRGCLNR